MSYNVHNIDTTKKSQSCDNYIKYTLSKVSELCITRSTICFMYRLIQIDFTKVLKDPVCRHEKYTKKNPEKYKAGFQQLYLQNKKLCEVRMFAYFFLVCFI